MGVRDQFIYGVQTEGVINVLLTNDPSWFETPVKCAMCKCNIVDTPTGNVFYCTQFKKPLCFECLASRHCGLLHSGIPDWLITRVKRVDGGYA